MSNKRTNLVRHHTLRRTIACFLALMGLWTLSFTIPSSSPFQWLRVWGADAQMVTAALAAQLNMGPSDAADEASAAWHRLLFSESSILTAYQREGGSDTGKQRAQSDDDEEEDPKKLTATAPDNIVEQTFKAHDASGYASAGDVYILNRTQKSLDVQALAAMELDISLPTDGAPQVLIMHTHGTEAYTQDGTDVYNETGTARTTDNNYNITRVGDEIERIFTEMGLSVLHDHGLYDYPNYNGSYDRSKAAVEAYLKQYPSIKIVLDVHRDALVGQDGTIYKPVTEIDGVKCAQILMVMGSDDGGLSHPDWQKNLSLAMRIQHRMNTLWPGLARPITLRSSRFNQQLTQGSILVEVGAHGNTLQEALTGARLFARSAGQVLLELKE